MAWRRLLVASQQRGSGTRRQHSSIAAQQHRRNAIQGRASRGRGRTILCLVTHEPEATTPPKAPSHRINTPPCQHRAMVRLEQLRRQS
jgi:hypothetical protein